jgi:hypothetical protein
MPKVRKGALVAFRLYQYTVHVDPHNIKPPRVDRDVSWRIGRVYMASREGKVKEIEGADGERYKMAVKHMTVGKVLYIPEGMVDEAALTTAARSLRWETDKECEMFVSQFVLA